MAKRKPTLADYIVIALSPALIMALVGSLCFFLIDVRYHGKMDGALTWVMFWFVLAIVLISRIAIERGAERAALFGLALGGALWMYLIQTSPAYLLALMLMALVWYCAHKLVWDCTLIDEEQDSSGQGLLQNADPKQAAGATPKNASNTFFGTPVFPQLVIQSRQNTGAPKNVKGTPKRTTKPQRRASESPGRSVLYFSLAALPLFGVGQMLLPAEAAGGRRFGFILLVIYMAAALGLLVTTSFLGLRRYLRQRYLPMPASIAFAWVKFGAGVAVFILIAAMFLPRPGAGAAWTTLSAQVDQQLRKASQYASRSQPAKPGEGRAGDQSNESGKQVRGDDKSKSPESGSQEQGSSQTSQPSSARDPAAALSAPAASLYNFLRNILLAIAALVAGWWLFRCRHLFLEMFRSLLEAIRKALLLSLPKPSKPSGPAFAPPARRPLAEFKNPFYADQAHSRPPEEIILYTYEAVQAWAREQGIEGHPEQTSREFCQSMETRLPDLADSLRSLSYLHAHAAYGRHLPADCDLEPLKALWRDLTWK